MVEHREYTINEPEDVENSVEFVQSLSAFERRNNCSRCKKLRTRLCNPMAKFEAARARGEIAPVCPNRRG